MTNRIIPLLASLSLGLAPASAHAQEPAEADPQAVIAAERAFAAAAQDMGQWAAFIAYSTPAAVMFAPGPVNAHEFLQGLPEPPVAIAWQPHEVWSSCDGTLAMTRGAWQQPDGSTGYFTTVWQRQDDGAYRWVLDQGGDLAEPLAEPAEIATSVADCRAGGDADAGIAGDVDIAVASVRRLVEEAPAPEDDFSLIRSADYTLAFTFAVTPGLARDWQLLIWQGGAMQVVASGHEDGPDR